MSIVLRAAMVLALLSLASWTNLQAQQHNAPELLTATVSTSTQVNHITINGTDFGTVPPTVTIDGIPLTLINNSDTSVMAFLPNGFAPGTYRLSLTNNSLQGNPSVRTGTLDVTLGAVG